MQIPDQLVSDIKSYLMKKPLGEVYGLYTKLVFAESEARRQEGIVPEVPAAVDGGGE